VETIEVVVTMGGVATMGGTARAGKDGLGSNVSAMALGTNSVHPGFWLDLR